MIVPDKNRQCNLRLLESVDWRIFRPNVDYYLLNISVICTKIVKLQYQRRTTINYTDREKRFGHWLHYSTGQLLQCFITITIKQIHHFSVAAFNFICSCTGEKTGTLQPNTTGRYIDNIRYKVLAMFDTFYRAMHFSAKRGITIACRLFVRLWRWWIVIT